MSTVSRLIAVVDDEPPVQRMLCRVLKLGSYQVSAYSSGEAFLASLDERVPACAILDVHLPGMSGFEVRTQMRTARIWTPVVFITAVDETALDRRALAGGSCLLRKPFSSDALLSAIREALEHREEPPEAGAVSAP